MRAFGLVVLSMAIVSGCGKDSVGPTYASAEGMWTYTTPDNAISVTFELKVMAGGSLEILNPAIVVGGTPGIAAGQLTGISLPTIGMIRINANDVGLVQPYAITFNTCSVSADFKTIGVLAAEYTYPWGTLKPLTNITIVRK